MPVVIASKHRLTPAEVVQNLRQDESGSARKDAIRAFAKYLRRRDRFHATWEAVGGARGLASLMAEFSVRDVKMLCARLGQTAPAMYLRPERRAGFTELVGILTSGETDARPLWKFYQAIVPACETEVIAAWEPTTEWTKAQQKSLALANQESYEQQFLKDLFSQEKQQENKQDHIFKQNLKLFRGNLPFCETILVRFASLDEDRVQIPYDFVDSFALPLLKKLSKHGRYHKTEHDKFLRLVVDCFKAHPLYLKRKLRINQHDGLVQHVLQRWIDRPKDREQLRSPLEDLLVLAPTENCWVADVYAAFQHPRNLKQESRTELLRLFLRHCDEYRVDIEDMSPAGQERILNATKRGHLWPGVLFLFLPPNDAFVLFQKLDRIHQGQSFISKAGSANSVLHQEQSIGRPEIDLDIVQTVLRRRKDPRVADDWMERVRVSVKERKKKATESREPRHRAFWAKSVLCLCIATENYEMLQESIIWARRFVKDPLVGPDIFGPKTIGSPELETLLTAVSLHPALDEPKRLEEAFSGAGRDIEPATQIIISLFQTALLAVAEPSFQARHWSSVVSLPENMARGRMDIAQSIKDVARKLDGAPDPESNIVKVIWKPTIDALLEIESLMSDPATLKIVSHRAAVYTAGQFMVSVPHVRDPSLLAEMTTQYLEGMKARLAPTLVKSHMRHVVQAVARLARGTKPTLAIPFIRPIIQNSDDSSSHRQLVTNSFLESLPASAARQFVTTTASAILDLMKEQNARPWSDPTTTGESYQPAVKVTTVKMMAQLLEGNMVLDPEVSFRILVSLLKEARHIDARVAIISSLLSTLVESTSTQALRSQILDVFEEHVLPMASQLNERRPTSEDEWNGKEMPEVSSESSIPTMLLSRSDVEGLRSEERERLVRIVMSALELSAVDNKRWMNQFGARHSAAVKAGHELSAGPAHLNVLVSAFSEEFDLMPESLISMLQDVLLNNVDPSPEIKEVTASVRADAELRESNAGKHWLTQFGNQDSNAFGLGLSAAVKLLRVKQCFKGGDERIKRVQQFITSAAVSWIRLGKADVVTSLMSQLTARTFLADRGQVGWRGRCMPVVEEVIRTVDQAWDQGSKVLLPNTFRLRFALLQVPLWQHKQPVPEAEISSFVEKMAGLIDRLAAQRRPYHGDLGFLKGEIKRSKSQFPDNARIGIALARLHDDWMQEDPSLAAYLRSELVATYLLSSPVPEDKAVKTGVHKLLEEWTACPEAEIRATGLETETQLKRQKGWYELE